MGHLIRKSLNKFKDSNLKSHLGIIMSETDFSKSLLHLIQFHHSTKLADTEFHEFTKLLYRYFAFLISKMMMR